MVCKSDLLYLNLCRRPSTPPATYSLEAELLDISI